MRKVRVLFLGVLCISLSLFSSNVEAADANVDDVASLGIGLFYQTAVRGSGLEVNWRGAGGFLSVGGRYYLSGESYELKIDEKYKINLDSAVELNTWVNLTPKKILSPQVGVGYLYSQASGANVDAELSSLLIFIGYGGGGIDSSLGWGGFFNVGVGYLVDPYWGYRMGGSQGRSELGLDRLYGYISFGLGW